MTVPRLSPAAENIVTAADCVRRGGVVVAPSDTNMALTVAPAFLGRSKSRRR